MPGRGGTPGWPGRTGCDGSGRGPPSMPGRAPGAALIAGACAGHARDAPACQDRRRQAHRPDGPRQAAWPAAAARCAAASRAGRLAGVVGRAGCGILPGSSMRRRRVGGTKRPAGCGARPAARGAQDRRGVDLGRLRRPVPAPARRRAALRRLGLGLECAGDRPATSTGAAPASGDRRRRRCRGLRLRVSSPARVCARRPALGRDCARVLAGAVRDRLDRLDQARRSQHRCRRLGRLGRLLQHRRPSWPPAFGGAGCSANMSPPGSAMLRCRAVRSTNERATTSSSVLDALLSSMPCSLLQQRQHFLARRVEQFRDFINANRCRQSDSFVWRRSCRRCSSPAGAAASAAAAAGASPAASARRALRPASAAARRRVARLERAELLLDLAALLFFALDVDAPAGQLGGEPHVLALLADGERQLAVLDHHFHHAVLVVHDRHVLHLRGAQRVHHERGSDPRTTRRCRSSRRAARG